MDERGGCACVRPTALARAFRSGSNDALLHQPPFLRGLRSAKEDAKANKPKKKKKQNASKKKKKPKNNK